MIKEKDVRYKPLTIETENVLFWGCTHFDHDKEFLWKSRGFSSIEEHNNQLIKNWNSSAETMEGPIVGVLLGDIMFGVGGEDKFYHFLDQLNCDVLLTCAGNHYAGFTQASEKPNDRVKFLPNYFELVVKRQPICCSHYPSLSWRNMHKGSIHLFSHVHGNLGKSDLGRVYLESDNKKLEVSVENSIKINEGMPFSLDDVLRLVSQKGNQAPDHHDESTR